jgi:DNA-binding transcriptional MerR regulator
MFRIRDFSRLARVSIKTLRHYDRLGLLAPAYVDPVTRYRWYAARQMSRLQRIVAFRQLGYSLEEIGSFIDRDPRSAVVRRSLVSLREEIARRIESDRQRLAQLDVRLRESDGSRAGDRSARLPDAVLQSLPPLRVASRRARVADLDGGAQELFEAVEADVARAGVRAVGPPLLLYHDPSIGSITPTSKLRCRSKTARDPLDDPPYERFPRSRTPRASYTGAGTSNGPTSCRACCRGSRPGVSLLWARCARCSFSSRPAISHASCRDSSSPSSATIS